MSDTAFQKQYRQEFVAGFEQHQSLLRECCTTEAVIKGNEAIFLVASSGGAEAQTRGVQGLINARADENIQNTALLTEWHDLVRKTNFNIFASQGNQRAIMQMTTMAVINRKIDDQVITALNTGTITLGGTTTIPNVPLFQHSRVKLQNADVPWDSNITLLTQASFISYLEEAPEFSSADYVDVRPFTGADNSADWRDRPQAYRWRSTMIVQHPNLPGKGTTSEKSFMFHKSSIGHAVATEGMQSPTGYNEEQGYSWCRASWTAGAKVLQNSGIIVITHNGSERA